MARDDGLEMDDLFAAERKDGGAARHTKRRSKPPSSAPASPSLAPSTEAQRRHASVGSANVLHFPASVWAPRLWAGKVTVAARTLVARKTEKGRQNYWAALIDTLARQMLRRGATERELDVQLDAFREAVQCALQVNSNNSPGAA